MGPSIDNTHTGVTDLVLTGIHKNFGQTVVLKELSLTVSCGELCCLLGPSGCGKTTVLRIIDGLVEPDRGTINLAGQNITSLPAQKRNIGLVFQNYALFPFMNVFDNVAYGLRRRNIPKTEVYTKVKKALETVKLAGYDKRRIHEISGGQQQRVALARSLVIEPALLLMDEPLSNLDARLRAEMRQEIKRIQKELNITTVYVTHDQEEAMAIADRIIVMNNGAIEQIGSPHEIYDSPSTEFVADFIGRCNFVEGEITDSYIYLFGKGFKVPVQELTNGSRITCAIRPERVLLQTVTNTDIKGKIQEVVYVGSVVRYQLSIEGWGSAGELTSEVPVSTATFQIGDNVSVEIKPEDVRLFPH